MDPTCLSIPGWSAGSRPSDRRSEMFAGRRRPWRPGRPRSCCTHLHCRLRVTGRSARSGRPPRSPPRGSRFNRGRFLCRQARLWAASSGRSSGVSVRKSHTPCRSCLPSGRRGGWYAVWAAAEHTVSASTRITAKIWLGVVSSKVVIHVLVTRDGSHRRNRSTAADAPGAVRLGSAEVDDSSAQRIVNSAIYRALRGSRSGS